MKKIDKIDEKEKKCVRNAKSQRENFTCLNPYKEQFGGGGIEISEEAPNWEKHGLRHKSAGTRQCEQVTR